MSMSVKNIGRTGQTNSKEHNNNISAGLTGQTGRKGTEKSRNAISAAIRSTRLSVSMARGVRSWRLPIGVETT